MAEDYNIHGVYNATHGRFIDLYECSLGLGHVATTPVQVLHKTWDNFFDTCPPDIKFLQNCHSQGAIHTKNALLSYSEEKRQRILVVAIAPGAYIDPRTCARVVHYRVKNPLRDFIPRIDRAGAKMATGTIVDLKSHPDAPLFDHEFRSPTYRDVLQKHMRNYINSKGQSL